MNPTGQGNNINGTPSVADRDASRLESDSSEHHADEGARPQVPDILTDPEKQWSANNASSSPPAVAIHEEKQHGYNLEDDSSISSSPVKDAELNRPAEPSVPLRRLQTTRSIAAAPFASAWTPEPAQVPSRQTPRRVSTSASRTRSTSTTSTLPRDRLEVEADADLNHDPVSRISTDAYGNTYPEGGREAYLCVLGSFSGLIASIGIMNTVGTYQAYLSTNQLRSSSEGSIGWIFGVYSFLSFFCGIQIGPIFDAYGPRQLIFLGSVFLMVFQLVFAQCRVYWHFMLAFGVCGGIGTSLIFTPAISAIGHWFFRKRGQFVGLAAAGGSIGGVIFPLAFQSLEPRIGFAWTCRVFALINLFLLALANLFIRSRLPRSPRISIRDILPDITIFRTNLTFTYTTLGVFFTEWALFIPLSYVTSYSLAHSIPSHLSYQLLAVLSAASSIGRYFPGLIADRIGRFNALVITIALCAIFTLALWLPANGSLALIIVYLVLFGISSGTGISLTPVCIGQLCKTEDLGRYYATCYTVASFATLTGVPIAGSIIGTGGDGGANGNGQGNWLGLILFTGCSYVVALACFVTARVRGVGWSLNKRW